MARGYDGTIRFDTSIDTKDFNAGLNKIGTAMKSILGNLSGSVLKVATAITAIVIAIAAVVAALVGASIAVLLFAQKFSETFVNNARTTSAYYDEIKAIKVAFDNLKGSVTALGGTLLAAIGPAVLSVINWLIQAIQYVTMFVAALMGQKQAMQYVAGSASRAAGSSKKAAKEARGALAAFDQINVLDQKKQEEDTSGGGSGGTGMYIPVNIDPNIQSKVDQIKGWFIQAWNDIKTFFSPAFTWIDDNIIQPIWMKLQWLWGIITSSASEMWNGGLKNVFVTIITFLENYFVGKFSAAFYDIKNVLLIVLQTATGIITSLIQIFGGLIQFISGVFTGNWTKAWEGIKNIYSGIFNELATVLGGVVNVIIVLLNGAIAGIISTVNAAVKALNTIHVTIPTWSPWHPGENWGFNLATITAPVIPQVGIPKLATGTVIPPNAEFLALLGDQKHGTNIKAPADLIRKIVREETQNMGSQGITVNFTGTMAALIQAMKPEIDRENKRIGGSLIVGA